AGARGEALVAPQRVGAAGGLDGVELRTVPLSPIRYVEIEQTGCQGLGIAVAEQGGGTVEIQAAVQAGDRQRPILLAVESLVRAQRGAAAVIQQIGRAHV